MATESVEVLIEGGKATAAPPLGPALGPLGVNIGQVVAEINKKTESFKGMQVPVKVEVDKDTKSFSIAVGTPPTSQLIKKEAGLSKGSGRPQEEFVADLLIEQVIKIAKMKEDALLGADLKAKVREVLGTCRSMGVKVEKMPAKEALREVNLGKFDKEILSEKTEVSKDELAELEEERKELQEQVQRQHKEWEEKAKAILDELKDPAAAKKKMVEAEIPDEIIRKLLPEEKKEKK
ncbi:50S ribosomal protein L11 [Candidatus Woesearchaeota archaeon]|nr:MAG: 50S ribosomal protein L11 [Candidatus Woesearchaeota archaeon]